MKFVRTLFSYSLAASGLAFVSCSYGRFVPLGSFCCPGYLVAGVGPEGCRVQLFRRVASGVHIYISLNHCLGYYSGMASAKGRPSGHSSDGCDDCCDDGELDVSIIGLRHAGDGHQCPLPDSAIYIKPATPLAIKASAESAKRLQFR